MGKMLSMGDHFSKFGTSELSIGHFSMFGSFELSIGHLDKFGTMGKRGGVVVVRKSAYGKMAKLLGCNSSSEAVWGLPFIPKSDEKPED